MTLLQQSPDGSFWMPPGASTVASHVDWLFNFILAISVFFFLLIVVVMTLFVIRYRRRAGVAAEASASHNTALEVTWTVIPRDPGHGDLLLRLQGLHGHVDARRPTPTRSRSTARSGAGSFTYPNGYVDANLHVPVDRRCAWS